MVDIPKDEKVIITHFPAAFSVKTHTLIAMDANSLFDQFEERYKARNLTDCQNQFIKDGIINPELYANQPIKVLFIAKEHNYKQKRAGCSPAS